MSDLLKMVAFADRPFDRQRDLADLAHILERYPPLDDPRRYGDPVLESGIPYESAGAFVLGAELKAMVDARERRQITDFVRRIRDESDGGRARAEMLRRQPRLWDPEGKDLDARLGGLIAGLGTTAD